MPLVVRSWNVFHGNADPPERRGFLRQMVELVTRDRPDVVCLQELPVWALAVVASWSRMHAARAVTALHHGWLRSALTGEADAILTRRPARSLGSKVVGRSGLRRIAHAVELDGVTVVNLHLDPEPAQLERAVALAGERAILAGDTNVPSLGADGFSPPLEGSIDQILVRGLALREGPAAWPPERRTVAGRLLSDHAPVEAVVG